MASELGDSAMTAESEGLRVRSPPGGMADPAATVRLSGHAAAYQIVKLESTIVIQAVIGSRDFTGHCVMPGRYRSGPCQ